MGFNEKTRVQIPAIIHLTRLGYKYLSLKTVDYDRSNNIVDSILLNSLKIINPLVSIENLTSEIESLKMLLKNNDLGRAFYERIIKRDGIRFLDFDSINNNIFNVVYEFPFINKGEEFRPDITILINGMPLGFAEVKVPMNKDLIEAERFRMTERFSKPWFKEFMNGFQLLVFSNNMKYDDDSIIPIQGAFYSTTSSKNIRFSTFREEQANLFDTVKEYENKEDVEQLILIDTNSVSIKGTDHFETNLNPMSPTNSILTSLFSKERLLYLLNSGICYLDEKNEDTGKEELKKHVMRYPQLFAAKAITSKLSKGVKKGIIWHTQGSGKTELAYYLNKILVDYYAKQKTNVKLFFIVDRLDLFKQATQEFIKRGLEVNNVDNKDDFERIIKSDKVIHNSKGKPEVTVVNIQKFSDSAFVLKNTEYDKSIQRVYFIDESHRSYGAEIKNDLVVPSRFLLQLIQSDKEAVRIGLTGTPIILEKVNTKDIFGEYLHKYYYNQSISDGYTLRLYREEILSTFVQKMKGTYDDLKIQNSKLKGVDIFAKEGYVRPLLEYITVDYENFILLHSYGENNLKPGMMIVCDSNAQAREIKRQLDDEYPQYVSLLILHNENTKEYREQEIKEFKKTNKYDFVIVDRMLLTGFDCPRLKRIYLLKVIRKHNLLQALTRVNRPFADFKYGYIVDFADISAEFKKTNDSYLKELKEEYGGELFDNTDIFISQEEIERRTAAIKNILFTYDTNNLENFSTQVQEIKDIKELQMLNKAIEEAKDIYGVAKLSDQLSAYNLDIHKINRMAIEVERAYQSMRLKESLKDDKNYDLLIDATISQIRFAFFKGTEGELKLGDKFFTKIKETQDSFRRNTDKHDPRFDELLKRLKEVLDNNNVEEISEERLLFLEKIHEDMKKLNRTNEGIASKYNNDFKYLKIHKRLKEKILHFDDVQYSKILCDIKEFMDNLVLENERILDNEKLIKDKLFGKVYSVFENNSLDLGEEVENTIDFIDTLIYLEYMNERRGTMAYGY